MTPEERIAPLAARAREQLAAGATLDGVLRSLRDDEHLGALECILALRMISPMGLSCAKCIVSTWCEGRSYAHLTLADVDLLGEPSVRGIDFFTRSHRDDAIIDRKPWLLYARKSNQSVYVIASPRPLAALPSPLGEGVYGSRSGASVSFESVAAEARTAAAAWPTELVIERDDPDEMLLQFVRAPR